MSYPFGMKAETEASKTLLCWANEQLPLDGWFFETFWAPESWWVKEKTGVGIITHLNDKVFAFNF